MKIEKIATRGVLDNAFAPMKKNWLPAVLGVAGLASSIFGGIKASDAAKRAAERQREREREENAWYSRRFNEDYLDTKAGQNLVRLAKDRALEHSKRAEGMAAVAGSTDAATQIAKDKGNKMVGDAIANIGAQDQARKDNIDTIHQQNREQYAQMDMDRANQQAQNITKAAEGASNALMSAAAALGNDGAKADLGGESNNSSPYVKSEEGVYVGNGVPTVDLRGTDASIRRDAASVFGR